ncbi:alpha/beta fold hydrolase [Gemmatimonas sp.]
MHAIPPCSVTVAEADQVIGDHTLRVRTIRSTVPDADGRPTLVFLHDSLGCISTWRDFPEQMAAAQHCHALVYDRRGYGRSSSFPAAPRQPDYLENEAHALEQLLALQLAHRGNKQVVLFGHSDGGSIALLAAALHPHRVRAIVTEGAHVFVEEVTLNGIRAAREVLHTTNLRERLWRHHGERTDGVTSAWIDVWLSSAFRDWNIERFLPRIGCPALILQGVDDEFGSPDQVRSIVEGISRGDGSGAIAHLIEGARHTPHKEAPDTVLTLALAFLTNRVPEMRLEFAGE